MEVENDIREEFKAQYKESLKLVKKYIDANNGEQDDKIRDIQEQIEAIASAGGGGANLALLNKLNKVVSFLKSDLVGVTNEVFFNGGEDGVISI